MDEKVNEPHAADRLSNEEVDTLRQMAKDYEALSRFGRLTRNIALWVIAILGSIAAYKGWIAK